MSKPFALPKQGFVFWPVGTGDSTTIVARENDLVMQLDLHHLEKSDKPDEPEWPIIDELVRVLPKGASGFVGGFRIGPDVIARWQRASHRLQWWHERHSA